MNLMAVIHDYVLIAISFGYLVLVARFAAIHRKLPAAHWILGAIAIWPLAIVDEWLKSIQGGMQLAWFSGLFDFVPVLVMAFCKRAMMPLLIKNPPNRKVVFWWPVIVVMICQLAYMFAPIESKAQWMVRSPVGDPLMHWDVYVVSFVTAFCVLWYGIQMTEQVQTYHHNLSEQVVDVHLYKVKGLAGITGMTVGIGFACILVVMAAAFGFVPLDGWQTLNHLLLAVMMLVVIIAMVRVRKTSPSPLDYDRLEDRNASQAAMRDALGRAEQIMLSRKAYKVIGLKISDFARVAEVEPTTLAIAMHVLTKRNFRAFVYHYRLEYAKNVLLHSDAKIAQVAKRLGLHSEKFLSGVLVQYLRKHYHTHRIE